LPYDRYIGTAAWNPKKTAGNEMQPFRSPRIARQEMEDAWRLKLEQALERYRAATREYRTVLRQEPDRSIPDLAKAIDGARTAESEALREYSRVLRIFTDLAIHGKLPEEGSDAKPEIVGERSMEQVSVVDDDESIRDSMRTLLRSVGYQVATFASAELFLDSPAPAETQCIILDMRMPGMDGLELQRRLNASQVEAPVIFLTAHDDARNRRIAMDQGAADFLCKPFQPGALLLAIETALTRHTADPGGV
jgi:CheY-like chemotaxis protein